MYAHIFCMSRTRNLQKVVKNVGRKKNGFEKIFLWIRQEFGLLQRHTYKQRQVRVAVWSYQQVYMYISTSLFGHMYHNKVIFIFIHYPCQQSFNFKWSVRVSKYYVWQKVVMNLIHNNHKEVKWFTNWISIIFEFSFFNRIRSLFVPFRQLRIQNWPKIYCQSQNR